MTGAGSEETLLRRGGRAARREDALPYGSAGTRLSRGPLAPLETARALRRAIGSAGERLVHTEEVTGSIPVSPTRSAPMSIFVEIIVGAIRSQVPLIRKPCSGNLPERRAAWVPCGRIRPTSFGHFA